MNWSEPLVDCPGVIHFLLRVLSYLFVSLCYGISPVPVRELLVRVCNAQNGRLLKRPASNLQPNWQAVGSEATGERYGGQACQVEGHVQAQQRRCCIFPATTNTDLPVSLLYKNGRDGQRGQYQSVDPLQHTAHTIREDTALVQRVKILNRRYSLPFQQALQRHISVVVAVLTQPTFLHMGKRCFRLLDGAVHF